ncbi:MAG: ribonuclease Z [Acutalibacteraceae bacterium]|nr:ribonuclease Z [Acutalibacteraceae bacterium]
MKIIVCVDKKNGMLFNSRRQSQDCLLRERIIKLSQNSKLWMNNYSAEQFGSSAGFSVSENFLKEAKTGEYCFIENSVIPTEDVEEIIIYKWNRTYPADTFLTFDLRSNGFKKQKSSNFPGNSHEKITEEIYIKK